MLFQAYLIKTNNFRLNRIYQRASGNELEDVDDQALMFKLVETGYGKAETWSQDTLKSVGNNVLAQMPSEFLRNLNPETVASSISSLKDVRVVEQKMNLIKDSYSCIVL